MNTKKLWAKLFGFSIGDRVKVLKVKWSEQKPFIGKCGEIVAITRNYLTEEIEYAVREDGWDEGERIWVKEEWIEIEDAK